MGGFMPVYMADRANGTIKFEPECAAYVHDVFGNKSFVPTFHEFVEISDTINRCNAQAIASRKK